MMKFWEMAEDAGLPWLIAIVGFPFMVAGFAQDVWDSIFGHRS